MRSRLGDHATEMFWLLEDTVAFGGRAALLPLLYHTCRAIFRKIPHSKHGSIQSAEASDRLYCMQGTKGCIFQIREHNTAITKDTDLIASTVSIWFIHVRISKSMFYHHVIEKSYIIIKVLAAHCTICQLYQVFYHDYKLWILSNHIFSQIYGQIWQN